MDAQDAGGWTLIAVAGEIDLATAPKLREEVLGRVDRGGRQVALDLGSVTFIDSSGLGAIVACLKHLRELGGELVIVSPLGSPVRKLFTLTGLDGAIEQLETTTDLASI